MRFPVDKNEYVLDSSGFAGIFSGMGNFLSNTMLGNFVFDVGSNAANAAVSGLIDRELQPDINVKYTPISGSQVIETTASETNAPASLSDVTGVRKSDAIAESTMPAPSQTEQMMKWLPFVGLGLAMYRTFFK